MKTRFLFPVLALIVVAAAASAQPRMASPEDQAKQLQERLKLSDTQVVDVTKILKDQREKMTKLRESSEMGPEMREAFQKLSRDTDEKMAKVLNEEQLAEYKKMVEEQRKMRGRRRSG